MYIENSITLIFGLSNSQKSKLDLCLNVPCTGWLKSNHTQGLDVHKATAMTIIRILHVIVIVWNLLARMMQRSGGVGARPSPLMILTILSLLGINKPCHLTT